MQTSSSEIRLLGSPSLFSACQTGLITYYCCAPGSDPIASKADPYIASKADPYFHCRQARRTSSGVHGGVMDDPAPRAVLSADVVAAIQDKHRRLGSPTFKSSEVN